LRPFARWSAFAVPIVLAVIWTAPLQAQESLDLNVLNQGKPPAQPVTISAVQGGEKTTLATTSASGTATIDFDMLNLGKGTPVGVHLVNCDGKTEIILLPPGEVSDECDKAREDPNCSCRRIGVILWGETSTVTVHLENGGSLEKPDETPEANRGRPDANRGPEPTTAMRDPWRIGVGVTYGMFPNLEDAGCVGTTDCEVDDSGLGGGVFLEYDLSPRLPIFVGLRGDYTSVSVRQTYAGGGTQDVDLSVYSAGLYGGVRLPLGDRVDWRFLGGPSLLWNKGDFLRSDPPDEFSGSRSESGLRLSIGTGFDFSLGDRIGAQVGYTFINGDEGDADQQHQVRAGISYSF
jgi:hypothetical protein